MKRLVSILTLVLILTALCGCSEEKEKYPNPTDRFFVNDFAEVLTDADETEFYSKASSLYANTPQKPQVVIVTIEDLNGDAPFEYATELGQKWGVGGKEEDNGVVILLSKNDREIFVAVGYGLEGDLPDSKTGRIIDVYGIPYFREDNFSAGLLAVGDAIINEIYTAYGQQPENYVPIENMPTQKTQSTGKVVVSWIALIIIMLIITAVSRRTGILPFFIGFPRGGGNFPRGGGGFGGFSGGGGSFGGGGAGRGF